jgi:putative IMPACT (imprinted ancient) family translation regulator
MFRFINYCCHALHSFDLCWHPQAHVAPVTQLDQVKAVVAVLLESNKIRNATHNIMAYRIAAPGRPGVFYQDFDDDGEAAAGGRLLHLLQVGADRV